jgi:hypothetical protein
MALGNDRFGNDMAFDIVLELGQIITSDISFRSDEENLCWFISILGCGH